MESKKINVDKAFKDLAKGFLIKQIKELSKTNQRLEAVNLSLNEKILELEEENKTYNHVINVFDAGVTKFLNDFDCEDIPDCVCCKAKIFMEIVSDE